MTKDELANLYLGYINCLNLQNWSILGEYVSDHAQRNGELLGLSGYRSMLEGNFVAIPDLRFNIDLLITDPPYVASRLVFDCTPKGELFGLPVNGKRVSFVENVFYRVTNGKIETVWSVIDTAAIEAQL